VNLAAHGLRPESFACPFGWVQLTFHHVCSSCDAYSITTANMQSLLDWLSTQVTTGAVAVETAEQVIGGTYKPPFCC
jgi:hypothetical protein